MATVVVCHAMVQSDRRPHASSATHDLAESGRCQPGLHALTGHYYVTDHQGGGIPVLHSITGYMGIPDGADPPGMQSLWAWSAGARASSYLRHPSCRTCAGLLPTFVVVGSQASPDLDERTLQCKAKPLTSNPGPGKKPPCGCGVFT